MNNPTPILLAEDDETQRVILRLAIERARLPNPVIEMRDGEEVVNYLEEASDGGALGRSLPALLLLDLKMPKMNGFEVLSWVRSHSQFSGLPVVMLSNSDQEKDIQAARALGVDDYFVKPSSLGELVELLHRSTRWLSAPGSERQICPDNPPGKTAASRTD